MSSDFIFILLGVCVRTFVVLSYYVSPFIHTGPVATVNLPDGDFFDLVTSPTGIFVDKTSMIERYFEIPYPMFLVIRPRKWGKTTIIDMLKRFLEIEVDYQGERLPLEKRINHRLFFYDDNINDIDDDNNNQSKISNGNNNNNNNNLNMNNNNNGLSFRRLKISESLTSMEKQGRYPTIYISFKNVYANSSADVEAGIRKEIKRILERQHNYLRKYIDNPDYSNRLREPNREKLKNYYDGLYGTEDLKDFLRFLTTVLYVHYKKRVHVFVDDYDAPTCKLFAVLLKRYRSEHDRLPEYMIYEKVVQSDEFVRTHRLIGGMFPLLKHNYAAEKTLISGVLQLNDLLIGVTNVSCYSLLDEEFSDAYGFTEIELERLLADRSLPDNKLDVVREWYHGYNVYGNRTMYNPWTIVNYLVRDGVIDYYWSDVDNALLLMDDLLSKDDYTKSQIRALMNGQSIDEYIRKGIDYRQIRFDGLMHILLFGGYLTPTGNVSWNLDYDYQHPCQLKIPNLEVKFIYDERILPQDSRHFEQR